MKYHASSRPQSPVSGRRKPFHPKVETLETRVQPGESVLGLATGLSLLESLLPPRPLLSPAPLALSTPHAELPRNHSTFTGVDFNHRPAAQAQTADARGPELWSFPTILTEFDSLFGGVSPRVYPDRGQADASPSSRAEPHGFGLSALAPPVGPSLAQSPLFVAGALPAPSPSLLDQVAGAQVVSAAPLSKPLGRPESAPGLPPSEDGPGTRGPGPLRPGFDANILDRNDDGSTERVDIGFPVIFYCSQEAYKTLFVNNNGNLTFRNPLGTYTPPPLGSLGQEIIAPFFADVDTRNPASGVVTYGQGMVDGHLAFAANWIGVGYYNQQVDRLNTFQVVLIDRSDDIGYGDFDIEFNYGRVTWDIGQVSDVSARAGYSTNEGAVTVELPGSAVRGAYLDGGPRALVSGSLESGGVLGRYVFHVHGLRCVDVDQVNYNGPNNVNIRIDGSATIGSPANPAGEAIEWVRDLREGPNTTANWDTSQAAPAAFVRGQPLRAEVRFAARERGVTQIVVNATTVNSFGNSPYGNIPDTTINIANGVGVATVTTDASLNSVDYNDITIRWHLKSVTIAGEVQKRDEDLRETTSRVYTVFANPNGDAALEPMRTPWARVLELSTALAYNSTTDRGVVEELTRGIHHSQWRGVADLLHFVDAQAQLIYNPSVVNTTPFGGPAEADFFRDQRYDLNDLLNNLNLPRYLQQCNDNSNLLAIFARSQGVNLVPKWVARQNPIAGTLLNQTAPYFPAGVDVSRRDRFTFHQFGFFSGMVYDPSTRPNAAGDPNMGLSLDNYMDRVFPGQRPPGPGFAQLDLRTLTIGPRAIDGFRIRSLAPDHVSVNTTTSITIDGARLDGDIRLRAYEADYSGFAAGVTIANLVPSADRTRLTFDLTVAAGATPRPIAVVVSKLGTSRSTPVTVTIDP